MDIRYQKNIFHCIGLLLISMLVLGAGCAQQLIPPVKKCHGKETIGELTAVVNQRTSGLAAMQAGGTCRILWYDSKGKRHPENLDIKLRFYPPDRLYFRGDRLGIEVVRVGTNHDDFWLRLKPKEISAYWSGKRLDIQNCSNQLWINPNSLLEALGVINVDSNWVFSKEGQFDVLTRPGAEGRTVKKIHFNRCDYLPAKIEYFDDTGGLAVVVTQTEYTHTKDGIILPTKISIIHEDGNGTGTSVDITLKNVKLYQPTEKKLKGLFRPPSSKGFEHIFKLDDNCEFIRQ